jgi:hypothetical protein
MCDIWLAGTSAARAGREGVGVISPLLGVFAIGAGWDWETDADG